MEKCALSVKETAQALGISESLTRSLIRRQELPSLPVGRRVLVPVVASRGSWGARSPAWTKTLQARGSG